MNITNNKKLKTLAIVASATILVFNLIFGIVLGIKVFGKNSNFVSVADQQVEIIWEAKVDGESKILIEGSIKNLGSKVNYFILVFDIRFVKFEINSYGLFSELEPGNNFSFSKKTGDMLWKPSEIIQDIYLEGIYISRV